ncbi:hypothetical protein [Paraburkholderia xenovorans]|uniref:hypothetical protein n=1 Tax=Paraburkholderia xenovorans TaxID=36873 RepID=UPI0038BC0C91
MTTPAARPKLPAPTHPAPEAAVTYGLARDAFGREIVQPERPPPPAAPNGSDATAAGPATKKEMATDALGRRAGALSDELDFPAFVSSLVHGTFDAMVDSSIRQMQSFADLVAAVAKPLEQFSQENVSLNQARDYLVEQHPRDIMLESRDGEMSLAPVARKPAAGDDAGADEDGGPSPRWLADYGHEGEELTPEFLEQQLLPLVRVKVAKARLQMLSTMVLLGMNRIVIKDGTIGARLRFRAAAADHAAMQYASSNDPGTGAETWGRRAGSSEPAASTKVSTVGVNVQSDSELKAELFGEVKINFASETLPLDRFIDDAKRTLLEGHSRNVHNVRASEPLRLVTPAVPVAAPPAPPAAPPGTPAPVPPGAPR